MDYWGWGGGGGGKGYVTPSSKIIRGPAPPPPLLPLPPLFLRVCSRDTAFLIQSRTDSQPLIRHSVNLLLAGITFCFIYIKKDFSFQNMKESNRSATEV